MDRYIRRGIIGMLAGLVSGMILELTLHVHGYGAILGLVIGIGYGLAFRPALGAYLDSLMTAAAFGISLWVGFSVLLLPLLAGGTPMWSAEGMRSHFSELVGWVLYGATLGTLAQALNDLATRWLGAEKQPQPKPVQQTRIVVLGGGFAGVATVENLENMLGADPSVEITLVSDTNAMLFTPMLAEVAGSSLEPTHISSPLRTSFRRTRVIRGQVTQINLKSRSITLAYDYTPKHGPKSVTLPGPVTGQTLEYNHLVLALGSVPNYMGMRDVQELAFGFKTLQDAIRIRNHIIDTFERADRHPDRAQREEMLTFVVAGGGFAGVEIAGALNDFARGILADYPGLEQADLKIILVQSSGRILPELSEPLANYAQQKMEARGVTFMLNTRIANASPGKVLLSSKEEIPARTLIWTAGTVPNPLLGTLDVEVDQRGAVIVENTLAVPEFPGLWAVGDCAAVIDAHTGEFCPPTAQYASREARILARNLYSSLHSKPPQPFHFDSLGALCVVGHHTACAEMAIPFLRGKSVRFSGLLAWLMWRGIYLAMLPGLDRKIRVMVDWAVELFFPRDIVQTIEIN